MSFLDLELKSAYDSEEDDILNDFYIPVFSKARRYDRLAGFFSSSALAAAARGIAPFIKNGGSMRLIVGAALQKPDVEAIKLGKEQPEKILSEVMLRNLKEIYDELVMNHVRALAWLIARNQLEIKVAIVIDKKGDPVDHDTAMKSGIFHQKVGIFEDAEGNIVSFSGSLNESATAWEENIEEFKVFRSWIEGEACHLASDKSKFEKYWYGRTKRVKIMDVPVAVRKQFIKLAPETLDELNLKRHYQPEYKKLWPHQAEAIKAWIKNGYRGIFAMATGTGKTLAALSASSLAPRSMVTVVLVPTLPLLHQWARKEIPSYDKNAHIIICGGKNNWKTILPLELAKVRKQGKNYAPKYRLYIVATMKTAASKGFLIAWKGVSPDNVQLICDEVHHLGAPTYQRCTEIPSSRRLGLSATPERDWDFEGTQKTVDYIGPTVYKYDIKKAINDGFLCSYKYFPYIAFLNRREFEDFQRLTAEIGKEIARINAQAKTTAENQEMPTAYMTHKLEKLLLERARIRKKAKDKIRVFSHILSSVSIRPLIVFCEDHEQLNEIKTILKNKVDSFLIYTSKMNLWQRSKTLDMFRKGNSDILLAIRCLDEGLDVPECRGCIIVASSSSTREFIQRRGRILRSFKGKTAILCDIIVFPPEMRNIRELEAAETLIRHELARMRQLVQAAENEWEVRNKIRKELARYGLEDLANL